MCPDDEANGLTRTMCSNCLGSTGYEETTVCFCDMGIQTDTVFTSSDAETQTLISFNSNCFQRGVVVQCYMDDVANKEKGSQTEVSICPSTFLASTYFYSV